MRLCASGVAYQPLASSPFEVDLPNGSDHPSYDIAHRLMEHTNSTSCRLAGGDARLGSHPWWLFIGLILAGFLMLPLDVRLSAFCDADGLPGELSRMLHRAEFFGHAYGVLGIAVTVYMVDVAQRRKLGRLLACSLGAGLAVDIIKGLVHRTRPHNFDFELGVAESFRGLSFLNAENWGDLLSSANHSLPSAHTAAAVGLAIALGWMYPHARRWFIMVACMVGASRVDGSAHFASDVFWGAAVGHLVAVTCLGHGRIANWFDAWESKGSDNSHLVVVPTDQVSDRAA